MKVVLLAGGIGTRLSEETVLRPKPMVEIGGMPILWHIMKIYAAFGFRDFVICLGYKGYMIKEYFANYFLHRSDVTINLKDNSLKIHDTQAEPWNITLVDTGETTMSGGRIKRIQSHIGHHTFMLSYGDSVGNVDIGQLLQFHQQKNKYCTVTTVQPSGRFGALNLTDNNTVDAFMEKPKGDGSWINGGFFVCEPQVFDYIDADHTLWEKDPMERMTGAQQLAAYRHTGFWKAMDTLRDKQELENDWNRNRARWKVW